MSYCLRSTSSGLDERDVAMKTCSRCGLADAAVIDVMRPTEGGLREHRGGPGHCVRKLRAVVDELAGKAARLREKAGGYERQLIEIARYMGKDASDDSGNSIAEVAIAEMERLQAIVAGLPTTADGVPVVPGMTLWDPVWPDDPFGVQALLVFCPNARRSEWMCNDGEVDAAQCYSTREAADAARDIPNAS